MDASVVPCTQASAGPLGHGTHGAPRGADAGPPQDPSGLLQLDPTPSADVTRPLHTGWDRRYWDSPAATSWASRRCLTEKQT